MDGEKLTSLKKSGTTLAKKGHIMSEIDNIETAERLEKFEAERLTADELYVVVGGLRSECTCGTVSVCHIDGTDDAN
jgi:hypothetical protein